MPPPYWHDFFHASVAYPRRPENQWHKVDDTRWERTDEWGNLWARIEEFSKGEVSRGVLQDLEEVETLPLPDLGNPAYYDEVRKAYETEADDKYRLGSLPGFAFNIARKMRRLDQYMMDLALYPAKMQTLHRRINDVLEWMIQQYARAGADAVMFGEDWGTQTNLMISPKMWREIFKPGFVRLCDAAHEEGLKVFMHSCGKITVIIPDLIEAGIDVLQFDQPRVHGISTLAQWADQVTFWCPVDIQTTLQTGDPLAIEADAKRMIEELGADGGGFIAGYYGGNEAIGVDPAVQEIACKAFVKYGWYKETAKATT
jgi:hypothetical protein